MTKQVQLTQGKVSPVSDHRFEHLNQFKWRAFQNKYGNWYAVRTEGKFPFRKNVKMHREITGVTDPRTEVDHRDGDGLNNQDENLRVCTHIQNGSNRKLNKNSATGFKGVSWNKARGKYVANIMINYKKVHLGLFTDPVEAAKAYDEGARKYHGEFANTNFEIQDGASSPAWFAAQKAEPF